MTADALQINLKPNEAFTRAWKNRRFAHVAEMREVAAKSLGLTQPAALISAWSSLRDRSMTLRFGPLPADADELEIPLFLRRAR